MTACSWLSKPIIALAASVCLLGGCLDYTKVSQAIREANAAVIAQEQAAVFLSQDALRNAGEDGSAGQLGVAIGELTAAIDAVSDKPATASPLRLRLALLYLNANLVNAADATKRQIVAEDDLPADRDKALFAVWDALVTLQDYRARRWRGEGQNRDTPLCPPTDNRSFNPREQDNICARFLEAQRQLQARLDVLREAGLEENRSIISYLNFNAGMISFRAATQINEPKDQIEFLNDKLRDFRANISCRTAEDHLDLGRSAVDSNDVAVDPDFIGPVVRLRTVLIGIADVTARALRDTGLDPAIRATGESMLAQTDLSTVRGRLEHCSTAAG